MPIHSPDLRLTYFPDPKVGTSTMRAVLGALAHGMEPETFLSKHHEKANANKAIAAQPFAKAMRNAKGLPAAETLVLVRDPVRRFFSGYENKVRSGHLARRSEGPVVPGTDLPSRPDLTVFLDNLEAYSAASFMIRKHFRSLTYFLGKDLGIFDHVHAIERFPAFAAFISGRLGRPLTFPHVKRQDMSWVTEVPPEIRRRVEILSQDDYLLLHNHYGADLPGITIPDWILETLRAPRSQTR